MEFDYIKKSVLSIVSNKKYQWIITFLALIIILFISTSIRVSNWDLLTDQSNGEKIPIALDPFYFLRVAETIVEGNGTLPEYDMFRGPWLNTAWHPEIMPGVIVSMWKLSNIFGDYTLREINVISPVVFFIVGLVIFFFLAYSLTKSKAASILSSALLAFSPSYLYRTMAGFSDHESIGMLALFAFMLFYVFALKNFEKSWTRSVLYGLISGLLTALVLATWGGAIPLVLILVSFSFGLYWLLKGERNEKSLVFYVLWIVSSIISPVIFNRVFVSSMASKFLSTYGLIVPAVFGLMLIDYVLGMLTQKNKIKIKENMKTWFVLVPFVVLGIIFLKLMGKGVFEVIRSAWETVLFPFGTGRVGLTVAENAQPYLKDWIGQSGTMIFWVFVFGVFMMGAEITKGVKSKKYSAMFVLLWVAMISAMIFSRISSSSILNGENFFSQFVYILGVGAFVCYFLWLNSANMLKKKAVNPSLIFLLSLAFIVVLNARSASRVFFLITPFVLLIVSYFIVTIFRHALKNKDTVARVILWSIFLFILVGVLLSLNNQRVDIANQAENTGPSANYQWQNAMSWVRNNTSEGAAFIHWWDYGYWIQTLGERPTISDGGHFQGPFNGNERIGRYLLTTDKPESAYSLIKTYNASYLLIDPSDLGKYSAYSKIGSDDNWDRFSMIPVGLSDESSSRETQNSTIKVYQFGGVVDEDIYYENIFLPGPNYDDYGRPSYKSYIGGVVITINQQSGQIDSAEGVYFYNNAQHRIPLRYVYVDNKLVDLGSGFNATIMLIPAVQPSGNSMNVGPIGAAIYLSPRTGNSLFAKLYLMDDPLNEYEHISLVHSEENMVIESLNSRGANVGDFIYYQGFRGPIKIWETDTPEETPVYEDFLKPQSGHADLDWRFE
jgi:asparagine N-glycosylation enzyme membrane subunit Stt3